MPKNVNTTMSLVDAGRIVKSSPSAQETASHVVTTVLEQKLPLLDEDSSVDFLQQQQLASG